MEPKSLDGNEDDDDDDSNLYAEIQANEEEPDQDSRLGKDYDCLDFYRNEHFDDILYTGTGFRVAIYTEPNMQVLPALCGHIWIRKTHSQSVVLMRCFTQAESATPIALPQKQLWSQPWSQLGRKPRF